MLQNIGNNKEGPVSTGARCHAGMFGVTWGQAECTGVSQSTKEWEIAETGLPWEGGHGHWDGYDVQYTDEENLVLLPNIYLLHFSPAQPLRALCNLCQPSSWYWCLHHHPSKHKNIWWKIFLLHWPICLQQFGWNALSSELICWRNISKPSCKWCVTVPVCVATIVVKCAPDPPPPPPHLIKIKMYKALLRCAPVSAFLVHPTEIAVMVFIHLKKQTTKTTNNQSWIHGENPTKQEKQMHKNTQQMLKH